MSYWWPEIRGAGVSGRQVTLGDIFTEAEIEQAKEIYLASPPGTFRKAVVAEIVRPAMPRIDKALGQKNDPDYMGYVLEFALGQMGLEPGSEPGPRGGG